MVTLADGASVVVVGGGPAASFFAIRVLRKARELGRTLQLTILERKTEVCFFQPVEFSSWEGCGYCAGGISPRLTDALKENGMTLPDDVVQSRADEVILHGDWKNIGLPVPEGREMVSVFRGSRPRQRPRRYESFDAFLLHQAQREGAEVLTAEVRDIRRSAAGRPVVVHRLATEDQDSETEADFAVFAAGVNRTPGMDLRRDPLFGALARVIPGLRPPKVRRAVICALEGEEEILRAMEGEVHFAQHGSKELAIEMCSLIPKRQWITVVLLGKTIDRASTSEYAEIVKSYLALRHIARLFPNGAHLRTVCTCAPNMVVGSARHPFDERIALVGDMAVCRLYKDGLYSAYVTGSALAECILTQGVDRESLRRRYWPVVRSFDVDNRYGLAVFFLSRVVFAHPLLSRIVYQAAITERKTRRVRDRSLAGALWGMASGDSSYRRILTTMLRPASLASVATGGVLVTARNYGTERLFGLRWEEFGRYPTGVAVEDVHSKRRQIFAAMGLREPERRPQVENMYSIRVRADAATILRQLGEFGDSDRQYFTPRFIRVRRRAGGPNEVGCIIGYQVTPSWLSFSVVLEKVVEGHLLLYRVLDGFARGGILVFDIEAVRPGVNLLTIYVGFDFPRGDGRLQRLGWRLGGALFPAFVHDVLWNQSLCKLRHLAEVEEYAAPEPGGPADARAVARP
jgi:flavin-dependent dehydrogenase